MTTASRPILCTPCSTRSSPTLNTSTITTTSTSTTTSPIESPSHTSSGWHFPGPSSRFNQREHPTRAHSRAKSTYAVAPLLHTERRAHRRAQSSYNLPTSPDRFTPHRSVDAQTIITSPRTPASSDRRALNRYSSFASSSSSSPAMAVENVVTTPAKMSHESQQLDAHDSPYSDYFTDDARSTDVVAPMPAKATQQLLVRLNKLQSAVMRGGNDSQALNLVDRRMNELESDMASLHTQSRRPPELEDSGLFMQETEEEDAKADADKGSHTLRQMYGTAMDGAADEPPSVELEAVTQKCSPWLLEQAQESLTQIEMVKQDFKHRMQEFYDLRERFSKQMRERDAEICTLRAENEHMQQDLKLDHGDFVLLDGQLRLLENKVGHIDTSSKEGIAPAIEAMRADCRKAIEKVNNKRPRYSECRTRPGDQYDEAIKLGRWKMDVTRSTTGRVELMVLERLPVNEHDEAKPHFEISDNTAEDIERRPRVLYAEQETQTEPTNLPYRESIESALSSMDDEEFDPRTELRQTALEDGFYSSDCAITTSPPSEAGDSDDDKVDENATTNEDNSQKSTNGRKGAWQELWQSMAELAGAGDHRW